MSKTHKSNPKAVQPAANAPIFDQRSQKVIQQFNIAGDATLSVNSPILSPATVPNPKGAKSSRNAMNNEATPERVKAKARSKLALESAESMLALGGTNGFTWLHLSDWHQKGPDFNRTVVRDALLRDLRQRAQIHPALAEVDFVIFSGDAAFYGKTEEYKSARKELFDPVLEALDLKPNQLFLVPGNHDLSRSYIEEMLPPALQKPLETDEHVQKWLTDEEKRSRVLEPFKEFSAFVARFTGQKPSAYANTWSGFIGDKRIGILCLNSAWMCARNKDAKGEVNDYGFLTLGEPQLHEALAAIEGADVRLAVLHHPFDWLARFDRNRVENRLKQVCHFILHGHEHQPDVNLANGLSGECAIIPAGACYDRRTAQDPRYTNAYNFVRLDFDTGQGVIFLRRWSDKRTQWIADTDSHDDGLFPFRLPKKLGCVEQPPPGRGGRAVLSPPTAIPPSDNAQGTVRPDTPTVLEYLRRLEAATSKLQLIGLGQGVQIELPIQQAYIPLNVVVAHGLKDDPLGHYSQKELQRREHVEENVLLGDMFKWAKRFDSRGVLLLGDPGAGKTTGARQFCWRVLQEGAFPLTERGHSCPPRDSRIGNRSAGSPEADKNVRAPKPDGAAETGASAGGLVKALGLPAGTIPVFLRLRQITPHHLGQGLSNFITDAVAANTVSPDLANPGPDLLDHRGVLWVFDGLDEVVNENARMHVCNWIKKALDDRPDDFFLVTSRYQGYQGRVDLGPAFCQFHVKPLNESQVAEFVERWYRAVFEKLHGQGADIAERAGQEIHSLMDLLHQPEYRIGRLRELPANPLLLTILCVVHHQDRNLPRRRADLYARCVRVLIEHWRKGLWESQGIVPYDPEAAEGVLASLAWSLHEQEKRTTRTVEELAAVAAKALADLGPAANLNRDGAEFIRRMREESGILAMWSPGQCGFLHLTFQEYLAGLHAAREGRATKLVKHIGSSWWREAILVAIAIGARDFAQKFFTALLETDAVAKEGALVDQCLDEALYAVLDPFLEALQAPGVSPERQLDILRRLRPFKNDNLTAVCRELARSAHSELRDVAREILQRAGVELERPAIEILGAPLELRVDSKTGIALITIPAGEFDMGSNDGTDDERPVHRVRISRPFQLGKYAVTNAEYQRFLEAHPETKPPQYWNDSRFNDPQQPVVGVSWHQALAFCEWAGGRLPTEAEWEYACRAGSQGNWCFGNDEAELKEFAWYGEGVSDKTHPVGQKKPNAWGLHDMHGNVWEWCADLCDWKNGVVTDTYVDGVLDPLCGKGAGRVVRGGSYWDLARDCRSAIRCAFEPGFRCRNQGFRLAAGQPVGRGAPSLAAAGAVAPGPEAPAARSASGASRPVQKSGFKS